MKKIQSISTLTFLATIALVATGCPSTTTMHTARPIDPGELEINIAPTINGIHVRVDESELDEEERDNPYYNNGQFNVAGASVEGHLRYGIAENMDFGIRATTNLQLGLDYNWAPVLLDNFALSLNPAFNFSFFAIGAASLFVTYGSLGILADVVSTENITLTLAAKPGFMGALGAVSYVDDNDESVTGSGAGVVFTMGGSLGTKIKISDNLSLLPEFSFLTYPTAPNNLFYYNISMGFAF